MSLLNDFLKTAPIKHKRGIHKCIEILEENNLITIQRKENKIFINLNLIEHIFDKRFTNTYEITVPEIVNFYYHFLYDNEYGPVIWIMKKQNRMPRKAVSEFLGNLLNSKNKIMYELDTLNLKSNNEL